MYLKLALKASKIHNAYSFKDCFSFFFLCTVALLIHTTTALRQNNTELDFCQTRFTE